MKRQTLGEFILASRLSVVYVGENTDAAYLVFISLI